jgi:hypothetical protein
LWNVFHYNKDNFKYDRHGRQKFEYTVVDMKITQASLWRDDVRTMVSLALTKMETYLLIIALLLVCCVTALCKGRVPPGSPPWLAACHTVSLVGAFMYLFMALWSGLHAFVSAQAYKVRILTHYVRLPIPQWQTIEAARTYGSAFEKMQGKQLLRVPWLTGAQESHVEGASSDVPASPTTRAASMGRSGRSFRTGEEPGVPNSPLSFGRAGDSVPQASDPWGLERRGDSGLGITELAPTVNAKVESQRHVWLVREAAQHYETYDAFCRIALSTGTCSLAIFLCYYCLSYVLTENASPMAAWCGMLAFLCIAIVLLRLDMKMTGPVFFALSFLMVVPAFISAMVVFENSKNRSLDMKLEWLMPAVPLLHGLWYLAYLGCFHVQQLEGDSFVPYAWRSVLYLDAFGWARHTNPSAGTRRRASVRFGTPAPEQTGPEQPAIDSLSQSAPLRPEDMAPQQSSYRDGDNLSFKPSSFAATTAARDEDEDEDILGTKAGELPWLMYKWTTVFLSIVWFSAGANDVFALATGDRQAEAFVRSQYFSSNETKDQPLGLLHEPLELLQGSRIETKWSSPLVRPRGLDCDSFGATFVTSGLSLDGKNALMTSAMSSDTVNFDSLRTCLDAQDTVEDVTSHCNEATGCSTLVLPRRGAHLVNCPMGPSLEEDRTDSKKPLLGAGRAKLGAISSSLLHRAWLDDRGSSPLDSSPFESSSMSLHDHPEEISAVRHIPCPTGDTSTAECVVVGTTARRVVLLARISSDEIEGKAAWVPQQVLNHDVGEVPGPGAFALLGKKHLGVLLRNASKVKLIDMQGEDSDSQYLHLPKDQRWGSICAGARELFAMEAGTNPSLWRFAGSPLVAIMPNEPEKSKDEAEGTAVWLGENGQWSFPEHAPPIGLTILATSRKRVPLTTNGEIAMF